MTRFGFASFTAWESQAGSLCRARCRCKCNAVQSRDQGSRSQQPHGRPFKRQLLDADISTVCRFSTPPKASAKVSQFRRY